MSRTQCFFDVEWFGPDVEVDRDGKLIRKVGGAECKRHFPLHVASNSHSAQRTHQLRPLR
jgi:hypothetical protein